MHILNYGLADPEWFFQLWMFCIFLFWINTVIHVLPEAPIQKITIKFYWKRQSKNFPDFIVQNANKISVQFYIWTVLSLRNLVGCRKKNVGVQEETSLKLTTCFKTVEGLGLKYKITIVTPLNPIYILAHKIENFTQAIFF